MRRPSAGLRRVKRAFGRVEKGLEGFFLRFATRSALPLS
jgi:hypothetical protein